MTFNINLAMKPTNTIIKKVTNKIIMQKNAAQVILAKPLQLAAIFPLLCLSLFASEVAAIQTGEGEITASKAVAKQPNIVFIMSDDHAANAISSYQGRLSSVFKTPNIDRLATNLYTQSRGNFNGPI